MDVLSFDLSRRLPEVGCALCHVLLRWRHQWVSRVETETGKVELVNTAANKTKLDDTDIAARYKTA